MRFNQDFLPNYLLRAPAALAVERYYECLLLSKNKLQGPVLDLGCGDGIFAKVVFADNVDLGIDLNASEVERARDLGVYKELVVCSGDQIPRANSSFKTILSNSVMEHIENIAPVLRESRRLLSPDGALYLTLPTDRFEHYSLVNQVLEFFGLEKLSESFRSFYNRFWRHYHCYSIPEWTQLFAENGLEVEEHHLYASKKACLLNDILAYFALPSLMARRFLMRWFFLPSIRPLFVPILRSILVPFLDNPHLQLHEGGLVFFKLRKRGES